MEMLCTLWSAVMMRVTLKLEILYSATLRPLGEFVSRDVARLIVPVFEETEIGEPCSWRW